MTNEKIHTPLLSDASEAKPKVQPRRKPSAATPYSEGGLNCWRIELTKGYFALVDECDAALSCYNWSALVRSNTTYASRYVRINGRRNRVLLHREIMNPNRKLTVDHVNRNGLDNRRKNLRVCTKTQNLGNQRKCRKSLSIFKGVCFDKRVQKWFAAIHINKKGIYLGSFVNQVDAAKAYDRAATIHFGQFACLNFQ